MKKIFCLYFLLLFVIPGFTQYTVTKVVGNVEYGRSGIKLISGSKLTDNDQLKWNNPPGENDMVRVLAAGKGVFILMPSIKAERGQNGILEFVKVSFKIKGKGGYLSGRAEGDESIPESLQTEEKVNSKNLFAAENKYVFDRNKYIVSDGGKFFLQIDYPGSPPIIRELKTLADTLFINSADFEILDKDMANKAKYKLGFFSSVNKTSQSLINIKPAFDYANEMETIIKIMINETKEKDQAKLKQECYAEVYEALGKPSEIDFNNAFYKMVSMPQKN